MSLLRRKKLVARLDSPSGRLNAQAKRQNRREHMSAWSSVAFVFVVMVICVSPNLFHETPSPKAGSQWPHLDVVTPYRLVIPNDEAAESQREHLRSDHLKVFTLDRGLENGITKKANELIAFLEGKSGTSATAEMSAEVGNRFGLDLKDATLNTLAAHAEASRTKTDIQTIFHHLLDTRGVSADKSLLNSAIRSDRALVVASDGHRVTSPSLRLVLGYPGELFDFVDNSYLTTFQVSSELKTAYADLVHQLLVPNIKYDRTQTESRLAVSLATVDPKMVLNPGSVVIRRGEFVTPLTIDALKLLHERERLNDILRVVGCAIFVMLAMAFTGLYARRFNRDLHFTSRSVLMVALPVVFAVSLGRVILNLGGGMLLGAFAMPAGMVGILTMMLFDERFAIVLTTMACGLFAAATGLAFPYTLMGLVGGYTAIASLRNLQERREVLFTGFYIAAANCMMAVAISLIMNPSQLDEQLFPGLVAALVNGVVCYMLAVAALPIFENIFQVTTDVRLLELTGANHKLLEMMEEKAPGTLYHSMNVAGLAEAAADDVGAHYLLVRAGAYFHDLGKMIKPTYFTENQSTPEQKQIHSKLSPAMSTLIIKNHVKDGVELAREYRLPEKVIDFIPEHHGTTLIKYFYVQALKKAELEGSDEIISEEEYRYPGPKPRSVETAILMLADSVEAIATSRFSGKNPDEAEIRRAVHEAVNEKYEDRQLASSPLTFRDLEIIKDAFVRVLQNRFHQRVKYPTMPGKSAAGAGAATGAGAGAADRPAGDGRKTDDGAIKSEDDGRKRADGDGRKNDGGTVEKQKKAARKASAESKM